MIPNNLLKIILLSVCIILSSMRAYPQGNNIQHEPQQQIKDFSISGFGEKGRKKWDLTGKSADITNDDIIKLNSIEGNFFTDNDDVKLTADKGDFNKLKNTVHVEDNVVITTASGTRLTTDSLDWDRKNQLLETRDIVNIERSNMVTTALGAKGRTDLNRVNLEKDVMVKIDNMTGEKQKSGDNKEIIITCDGPLEVDYQKNIAVFNNNVKVDMQDSTIESDIMEIYFSKTGEAKSKQIGAGSEFMGSQIDKIVSLGNVKIVREANVSYSEMAVYSAATKKITLSGKPKLILYTSKDISGGLSGKPASKPLESSAAVPVKETKNTENREKTDIKLEAVEKSLDAISVGEDSAGFKAEKTKNIEKTDVLNPIGSSVPDFEKEKAKAIEAALGTMDQ